MHRAFESYTPAGKKSSARNARLDIPEVNAGQDTSLENRLIIHRRVFSVICLQTDCQKSPVSCGLWLPKELYYLWEPALRYSKKALHYAALYYSVWQCDAVCCSVLRRVAVSTTPIDLTSGQYKPLPRA